MCLHLYAEHTHKQTHSHTNHFIYYIEEDYIEVILQEVPIFFFCLGVFLSNQ